MIYKPEDFKIKKVEFPDLNKVQFEVHRRIYYLSFIKFKMIPSEDFRLLEFGGDYGYSGIFDNKEQAEKCINEELTQYFKQPIFAKETWV